MADTRIAEQYGDLAYADFNDVFKTKGEIVKQQYGQTIKVTLKVDNESNQVTREVTEDVR